MSAGLGESSHQRERQRDGETWFHSSTHRKDELHQRLFHPQTSGVSISIRNPGSHFVQYRGISILRIDSPDSC